MSIGRNVPATIAGLLLAATPLNAQMSDFCTEGSGGVFELAFDLKPSLVVHSDAVLDATRGDLGLDGATDERAFSFSRTIATILESAGAASDQAAQEAFLTTMLGSFTVPTGQQLNAQAGIFMPYDDRPSEAALSPAALLDESDPDAMVPLALFNRFDLAPETWSHCGEHRIVYGKNRPNPGSPFGRFLLIFEAMVPNPDPAAGEAGCRRVTEFWASLTGMSDAEQAAALSGFYYEGATGHADGDLMAVGGDGTSEVSPVVNFRNYGGDGNRGQVRANAFMAGPWQLREWLTQLTFAETGPTLAFVPVTVKDNPLAQLYLDDITSDADVMAANIPAAVTTLHGQFIQALTSNIVPNLMSEGGEKHTLLTTELGDYDLGPAPVDEETVLLNTIALGNSDKFNEHQSISQGAVDVPGSGSGSPTLTSLLDAAGASPNPEIPGQSGQTLLNRARVGTCGGCHMTASRSNPGHFTGPGVVVRENADATVVRWPDVHSGGFVHVNEPDRALSAALEDEFLPFRRYIMGRHLCQDLTPPAPPPPDAPTNGGLPDTYEMTLAEFGIDLPSVATSERYLDDVVGSYLGNLGRAETESVGGSVAERASGLTTAEREGLRMAVSRAITAARTIELEQVEGAYVETRRPH